MTNLSDTLDLADDLGEAISLLKSCRLMLYAWRGARERNGWGEHPELNGIIAEIEKFIANR